MTKVSKSTSAFERAKVRLLIVDDSASVQNQLTKLCELAPHIEVVGCAGDGCDGLQAIREMKPDLVTLDLGMPGMNGIEVLHVLKAQRSTCKIIVLSSFGESIYQKCFELGATYVLDKTKDIQTLLEILMEA